VAFLEQVVAEMRAEKSGAPGDDRRTHFDDDSGRRPWLSQPCS
jgi:hypothetical protein